MVQQLPDRLNAVIEENLQNGQFGVTDLADAVGLSKSQLNRKLHSLTGQSASQFIREYRLKKARELLTSKVSTPTEVAYSVGFNSPSYFSSCFKEFYGYAPSEVDTKYDGIEKKVTYTTWAKVWIYSLIAIFIVTIGYIFFRNFVQSERNKSNTEIVIKSIAILPFKNLSNNEDDQYLADGMMEAIHTHLQRIGELSLRSSTSTEAYRNTTKNMTKIGRELEVNYILEGSFQKIGDQVNLAVRLISTKNDEQLWSEDYTKVWSSEEIFDVQKEVAMKVVDGLNANLTDEARRGIDVIPTDNIRAYERYLKGIESFKSYWRDRDKNNLSEAAEFYIQAIELDQNFSLAYNACARTYKYQAIMSVSKSEKNELLKRCRKYIRKAIELNPYNGAAYAEYGSLLRDWKRDTTRARRSFETAIKLEPNNLDNYNRYFQHELLLGNCDKLKWIHKRMCDLNPTVNKPSGAGNLKLLHCQKKYSEIAEIADKYGLGSSFPLIQARFYFPGYLYSQRFDKANQILNYFKEKSKEKRLPLLYEGLLRAAEGNTELALASIDSLHSISTIEDVPDHNIAQIYAALGDEDQMYKYLEKGLSSEYRIRINAPEFIPYHDDPRFQEIVSKFWTPRDITEE